MTRGDSRTSVFEELKDVDLVRWELDSESAKHPYKAEKLQSSVSERRGTEGGEKQGQSLRIPTLQGRSYRSKGGRRRPFFAR